MSDDFIVRMEPVPVAGDLHSFQPLFMVSRSGQLIGSVYLSVSGSAALFATSKLGADPARLNEIILRYGVDRLERQLLRYGGAEELFTPNSTQRWLITSDDLDSTLLDPRYHAKDCQYQIRQERDLYCAASGKDDGMRVGSVGARMIAPTSQPICEECVIPDGHILCSSFTHPSVSGLMMLGQRPARTLGRALCNKGDPRVDSHASQCKPGGNECWSRHIPAPAPPTALAPSPLSLPESLDFLDAVWRLGGREPLVRPSNFVDAAGLTGDCSSPEEFESRLSDIADALDQFKIETSSLPEGKERTTGSLNRLREVVCVMEGVDVAVVNNAIVTLQKVVRLRVTHQHSDAATERPGVLRDLGIPDSGISLSDTLARVRNRATAALLALRSEIRRAVDATGHE